MTPPDAARRNGAAVLVQTIRRLEARVDSLERSVARMSAHQEVVDRAVMMAVRDTLRRVSDGMANRPLPVPQVSIAVVSTTIEPGGSGGRRNVGLLAYELREAGFSWRTIATELGYDHMTTPDSNAAAAARYYAARNGRPWPIDLARDLS